MKYPNPAKMDTCFNLPVRKTIEYTVCGCRNLQYPHDQNKKISGPKQSLHLGFKRAKLFAFSSCFARFSYLSQLSRVFASEHPNTETIKCVMKAQ